MSADRRLRVLLIDDEMDLREELGELLTEAGFSIRTATNGLEALSLLGTGYRPQVILLDLMMPVMDGWQTRDRLLATPDYAQIPVVVVSGVANDEPQLEALRAAAYLTKPVSVSHLCAVIEAVARETSAVGAAESP